VDWTLFHAVNGVLVGRDWLEDPATGALGVAVPLYATATVGLWLLARPYGLTRWKRATVAALLSASLALLANQAIAHAWDRPRPFAAHPLSTHLFAAPSTDPSFPSDHAAAAFAIAVAVLAFSRVAGSAFLAAATLIALSRVVLGLHYPSDVLAGAAVGAASALLVTRFGLPAVDLAVRVGSTVTDPVLARIRRAPDRAR
jgi:undecaprenyl-diphosphatase